MSGTPLTAFAGVNFEHGRLFDTDDLDEVRTLCGRVFNPHVLQIVGRNQHLQARMDHLPIGSLSLNRLTWGAEVAVDPDRLRSYYLISMPTRGRARFCLGGKETDVTRRQAGIVNATQRFHFKASADFEQIVVRIDRAAIETGWEALTGRPPESAIEFTSGIPLDGAGWRSLEPIMHVLRRRTQHLGPSEAARFLDARIEEQLVITMLLNLRHNLSDYLLPQNASASSPHFRRARAWMLDRLEEPLTISDVARTCGVSIRTLQSAFHDSCGIGPIQWLRRERLQRVHEALLDADGVQSVTDIALRFGFTHLGEFSTAYRRMFSETPSRTRARRG